MTIDQSPLRSYSSNPPFFCRYFDHSSVDITSQPDYLHNRISVQSTRRTQLIRCYSCSFSTICIFHVTNHQPLFQMCITLPVESVPIIVLSTSSGSLFSWFTLSCTHHLITVSVFALNVYRSLGQTYPSVQQILSSIVFLVPLNSYRTYTQPLAFVLVSSFYVFLLFGYV